jgi:aspartate racemase
MRTLGIVTHSAEGASLCFQEACRSGGEALGAFMHPTIVMSAVPMALSMPGWESDDHAAVAKHLSEGVRLVAAAGADFYICPDNTAHIVLETIATALPIPGLHIAEVVCAEAARRGFRRVGLPGTRWTMTGPLYERAIAQMGMERLISDTETRAMVHTAIFEELCRGVFRPETTQRFVDAITRLRARGADCVVLGCTEIPLIINDGNSPLPVLDSTRLLAQAGVRVAVGPGSHRVRMGWIEV